MKPRVTQTDIARAAGVHNTTVSLSLRNCPSIPEATRKRIQAIAAQMGYAPDPALQALVAYRAGRSASRRQQTLAYITNWDTRWGWRAVPAHEQFHAGAARKAAESGYQFEHFWLREPGVSERRLSQMLYHRGITGVLLASHLPSDDRMLDLDWSHFSAVKIERFPHTPALHYVANDPSASVRLAVQRAIAAGYQRVGLVMPRWWDDYVDQAWSIGFASELNRQPTAFRVPILYYDDLAGRPGAAAGDADERAVDRVLLATWFRRYRPDAIVSHAPFIRRPLQQIGLSTPHDVGYADLFLESADGHLAGIRQNCERVGEVAVEMLVHQLQHNIVGLPTVPSATLLQGTWVDGESLAPKRHQHAQAEPAAPALALTA